jgi:hypothetical protein
MGRISTPSGAAGRVAWMMAECRPGAASLVGVAILTGGEGSSRAAGQAFGLGALGGVEAFGGDDVADPDPAAGAQHTERLGQHAGLVGGQVDHAVGDDHVHGGFGQRDVLDVAGQELGVVYPGLRGVVPGEGDHVG